MLIVRDENGIQPNLNHFFRLFTIVAIGYIISSPFAPYSLSPLLKVIPIILLAVVANLTLRHKVRLLTLAALFFSGCGDVLLALQFQHQFVFGLGSFLIAHLFYCVVFYQVKSHWRKSVKLLFLLSLLFYGMTLYQHIIPHTGELEVPVTLYMLVITLTCCIAIFTLRKQNYFMAIGAFIFVLSDSLIAWNMFVESIYLEAVWVMSTYYLAQFLIVYGLSKSSAKTPSEAAVLNNN